MNQNFNDYTRLKADKNYIDVAFNEKNGGLMATHIEHNFDPKRGIYEKEVQEIGYKHGNAVIFESEKGDIVGKKYTDGLWNGKTLEIGTSLGIGKNNIKAILNHAREKNAEVAIIYFPDKSIFSSNRLHEGVIKYTGQTEYKFDEIIYIVDRKIYRLK